MTKAALLNRLDSVMADAERIGMYGEINIVLRNGEATVLRTLRTEQLDTAKNAHQHETSHY